ncbi:hypothetical protein SSX86_025222 [Deinandra increscens subsp. villosa]|uniref:VQ domain-containing protein n=1 Tax=Deinandra increscens subsp. villosa TaxID=3103831 RepID=A0AAP0CCX7_9ASTR
MDQITYTYSYSSSSSSSSSSSNNHPPKTIKPTRPSYKDSLHSVRKPTQKQLINKQFIAPLPPTPHKVYNVTPSNFKDVVRMLTGTPEFQSPSTRRLKDIAPPPLILSTIPKPSIFPKPQPSSGGEGETSTDFTLSPNFSKFLNETLDTNRFVSVSPVKADWFEGLSPIFMSPLALSLSPSSLSWCSSLLHSPTNLSGFNQNPIL